MWLAYALEIERFSCDALMMYEFGLTQICTSQPQQLSTYALTLFKYKTEINNQVVHVGTLVLAVSSTNELDLLCYST